MKGFMPPVMCLCMDIFDLSKRRKKNQKKTKKNPSKNTNLCYPKKCLVWNVTAIAANLHLYYVRDIGKTLKPDAKNLS